VSHDRAFIDRLATRVLDLRAGRPVLLDGNYSETAEARADRRRRPELPARAPNAAVLLVATPSPAAGSVRRGRTSEGKEAAKLRRRIQALEDRIAALEGEVQAIETRLWDEALTLGPLASRDLAAEKAAKKLELDGFIEEWERLSGQETERAGSLP
jgi:ATP-binding cassette subfamily F protein 3